MPLFFVVERTGNEKKKKKRRRWPFLAIAFLTLPQLTHLLQVRRLLDTNFNIAPKTLKTLLAS